MNVNFGWEQAIVDDVEEKLGGGFYSPDGAKELEIWIKERP